MHEAADLKPRTLLRRDLCQLSKSHVRRDAVSKLQALEEKVIYNSTIPLLCRLSPRANGALDLTAVRSLGFTNSIKQAPSSRRIQAAGNERRLSPITILQQPLQSRHHISRLMKRCLKEADIGKGLPSTRYSHHGCQLRIQRLPMEDNYFNFGGTNNQAHALYHQSSTAAHET